MRVHLTNVVSCNGGDAAILRGVEGILRAQFGEQLRLTVADSAPDVVAKIYPDLQFGPLLFDTVATQYRPFWRRPVRSLAFARFWAGARALAGGNPAAAARLLSPLQRDSLQRIANAEIVISTGGTYLTENYPLRSRFWEFRAAELFQKPLVLMSQSIGPFADPEGVRELGRQLQPAQSIMVRDPTSAELLTKAGVGADRIVQIPDAAFALYSGAGSQEGRLPVDGRRLRAVVSVRSWKHFGDQSAASGMAAYVQAVAGAVLHLVRNLNAEVTFLSTCQGISEYWTDDSALAEEIAASLPSDIQQHVEVDRDFHDPRDLIGILREYDVAISTRMHFAIMALMAQIPVVPISYEFKTTELFRQLGQGSLCCDIERVTSSELSEAVERAIQMPAGDRAELGRRLEKVSDEARRAGRLIAEVVNAQANHASTPGRRGTGSESRGPAQSHWFPIAPSFNLEHRSEKQECHAANEDAGTRLWMACPALGVSSEAWMYRQAVQLMPGQLRVVCWAHHRPTTFPEEGFSVEVIPSRSGNPFEDDRRFFGRIFRKGRSRYEFSADTRSRLEASLRRDQPEAVLCQYGHLAIAMLRVAQSLKIPTFVHFHGNDISARLRKPCYRDALRSALPHFAGIVCVANYQRDWLIQNGVAEERIRVIPCGVPLQDFRLQDRTGRSGCRFVTVGRLVEKKSPDLTIRAFAMCAAENPDAELTIVGDGKLRKRCERLVGRLGLSERVRFAGVLAPQQVADEIAAADVYVQHSVTTRKGDMEGWPVSIAEAAASGLPVIATRHAGIVEQVSEQESGLLCDEHDWRQMGRDMARLASSAELRLEFGAAARRRIEHFDTAMQVAKLRAFIGTVQLASTGKAA